MIFAKKFEKLVSNLSTEWRRTAFVGLVGGIIFGVIIQFGLDKMTGIGILYESRSLVLGWIAHLFHSVVGALIFMGIISRRSVNQHLTKPSYSIVLGMIYGFLLWIALTIIILPFWFGRVAPWNGGPLQNFTNLQLFGSLVGFLVYGMIVGGGVRIQLPNRE